MAHKKASAFILIHKKSSCPSWIVCVHSIHPVPVPIASYGFASFILFLCQLYRIGSLHSTCFCAKYIVWFTPLNLFLCQLHRRGSFHSTCFCASCIVGVHSIQPVPVPVASSWFTPFTLFVTFFASVFAQTEYPDSVILVPSQGMLIR